MRAGWWRAPLCVMCSHVPVLRRYEKRRSRCTHARLGRRGRCPQTHACTPVCAAYAAVTQEKHKLSDNGQWARRRGTQEPRPQLRCLHLPSFTVRQPGSFGRSRLRSTRGNSLARRLFCKRVRALFAAATAQPGRSLVRGYFQQVVVHTGRGGKLAGVSVVSTGCPRRG